MNIGSKRKAQIVITLLMISLSVQTLLSQIPETKPYKAPEFIFELCGSFDDPTGSSNGDVKDFFSFKNYGLTYGLGFQFNLKYAADKKASLYPFISAGFTQLQNNDDEKSYIDSNKITGGYPLPGSLQYNSTPGSSVLFLRNFYAGAGLQYYFSSRSHILPFAGLELTYNYIWGSYVQNPRIVQKTFDISGASRFGFGVNLGSEIRVNKYLGFVLGVNYKFTNLLGKNSERSTEPNTISLLDRADTGLNSNLNSSRNIEHFEFYLGFVLFAGSK